MRNKSLNNEFNERYVILKIIFKKMHILLKIGLGVTISKWFK
jgi:hypothetical protein